MTSKPRAAAIGILLLLHTAIASRANEQAALPPIAQRYSAEHVSEVPSFQRHVVPLFGRLGCNGRSCHGSFQGRGGFQLSLFGYDFAADHAELLEKDRARVHREMPLESLILTKPTSADDHEGGQRYQTGSWEYHVLRRWIEAGATFDPGQLDELVTLHVRPAEIIFDAAGQQSQLTATAVWKDGTREDVTPLCRFQTNDSQIAEVDEAGLVTGGDAGDSHIVVFYDKAVVSVPVLRPASDNTRDRYPAVATPTRVDELVIEKLRKLGVLPSDVCTDSEFLRRVKLDLTGTLPTPQEVESFLADAAPDKRARKIDELLETPAYAAWWTTRLCDFTGNNDDQTVNSTSARGQAGQDWYDWIHKRVADNVPYDRLVEGIVLAKSRNEGESYYEYCQAMSEISQPGSQVTMGDRQYMPYFWSRRDFRRPPERAISFAYAFLGVRIECAQCHKHPFDQWSKKDFEEFSKFFGGVAAVNRHGPGGAQDFAKILEELDLEAKALNNKVRRQLTGPLREGKVVPFPEVFVNTRGLRQRVRQRNRDGGEGPARGSAVLLGGQVVNLNDYQDHREPLMQWLRDPANPYFARAFVNRVWAAYMGVGIVEPPDDHSLANPPSNKALLDHLAMGFIESGFDMKWVHREILNSLAYQRSWRPNETNASDKRNFSRAQVRRLPAEVAYDAVQQATASDTEVVRLQSDLAGRAITLAGSGTRGNQNRDAAYAMRVFGRSTRESNCDCDRSTAPSLLQTIFLQNDQSVLAMIDRPANGWLAHVRQQLEPPASGGASGDQAMVGEQLERRIKFVERRIARLRAREETERLPALESQLERMKRRLSRLETVRPATESQAAASQEAPTIDTFIQQAYLRTVSRYPTDEELARNRQYVHESADPVSGLRDVLWALLNTKEFIVNY